MLFPVHIALVWATVACSSIVYAQESELGDASIKFVQKYCVSCHGPELEEGDRRFDHLVNVDGGKNDTAENREYWREVLDRLNLADMPPEDADLQPTDEERLRIIEILTKDLSKKREGETESTSVALRRLNLDEYDLAVRKLLGLENMLRDPTASFSPDSRVDGFDNVGQSLQVTDFLMKQYLKAADEYLDAAIVKGTALSEARSWKFRAPFFRERNPADGLNEAGKYMHIRESSSGHGFFLVLDELAKSGGVPESGYYDVRIEATAINRKHPYKDWIMDTSSNDPLVMSIVASESDVKKPRFVHSSDRSLKEFEVADDEAKWYEATVWIDRGYSIKLGYPNGPRRIKYMRHSLMSQHRESFPRFLTDHVHVFHDMHPDFDKEKAPAMVEAFLKQQDELKKAGKRYDVFGVDHALHTDEAWKTFYREYKGPRIRVSEVQLSGPKLADPVDIVLPLIDENISDARAKETIREFATRAASSPVDEETLGPIFGLFDSARERTNANEASRLAYKAILCSPSFIYHRNRAGKLDDFEFANRLSRFLTGLPADAELYALAESGKIADPKMRRQQTERLLASDESRNFVSRFLDSWLHLSKLGTMQPDENKHAVYFNERLESAMREETILFMREAFAKDRPVQWLIDADQTFVNAPLARLYGIWDVEGLEMRQVKISDSKRGGLLGHASVLTATANGIDTSPVTRGVWVLECLLGTPPSPPPPDVEPLEPDIRDAATIREQLSKHREVASCRHCHRRIDPLGFALESFDEIGRVRNEYGDWNEKKLPIDTAGKLPSGESFEDISGLRKLLSQQSPLVERNFVAKLLVQATGRVDDLADNADVLKIVGSRKADAGLGMRELIHRVIASDAFSR
jgi:hypothetical protein